MRRFMIVSSDHIFNNMVIVNYSIHRPKYSRFFQS
jgi:hypothetical protein